MRWPADGADLMRTICNCARIRRPCHAGSGVTVASGNGRIVGHGDCGIVRIVAGFEEATVEVKEHSSVDMT